jgi:hypothetical protein
VLSYSAVQRHQIGLLLFDACEQMSRQLVALDKWRQEVSSWRSGYLLLREKAAMNLFENPSFDLLDIVDLMTAVAHALAFPVNHNSAWDLFVLGLEKKMQAERILSLAIRL